MTSKIAIVSDYGLPDPWLERAIYTLINNDYQVHFIGNYRGNTGIFDPASISIHEIPRWSPRIRAKIPPYYTWMKRRVSKILKDINPDIVIAINVYAGIMVHELGYPMILVDLETYGFKRSFGISTLKGYVKYREYFMLKKTMEYEALLAVNHPVIVVTKPSYVYYKYHLGADRVEIVKAYPLSSEGFKAQGKEPPRDRVVFMFIGREISRQLHGYWNIIYDYFANARIIKPTIETFYKIHREKKNFELLVVGDNDLKSRDFIRSIGYVKHHVDIYEYIGLSHYGICTYRPSLIHLRGSINRVYMFTLIGLPVFITSTYIDVLEDLREHAIVVDSYNYAEDLHEKLLASIKEFNYEEYVKLREEIRSYALKNLVWERQESKILNVLSKP